MALPVTISSTVVAPQNSSHVPVKSSGGAFYVVLIDSADNTQMQMFKATDPTSSFTETDAAGEPSTGLEIKSLWTVQDGDDYHVWIQGVDDPLYSMFDMSADAWEDVASASPIVNIDTGPDSNNTAHAITGWVRSDGDKCAVYQGKTDMVMGTEYQRLDFSTATTGEGTWASPVAVDNGGADHWTGCSAVLGSSDRGHIFFTNADTAQLFQRTIRSDDSLETFPAAVDVNSRSQDFILGPGVSYDDGGTQRVRVAYHQAPGGQLGGALLDSADSPGAGDAEEGDITGTINAKKVIPASDYSYAVNVKDLLLLFSGGGTDGVDTDLYLATNDDDAGWDATPSEELDAVTINAVFGNVYDRSGTKLAYIYDDGGTIKYNEISLAAVVIPTIHLIMAPYRPT